MSDDDVPCPFCKKADGCKHLVASFDCENAAIGGGYFLGQERALTELVRQVFSELLADRGPDVDWSEFPDFEELWGDFVARQENLEEESLDSGLLAHLLDDLLQSTDATAIGEDPVVAYFARKPLRRYEAVVAAIQHACKTAKPEETNDGDH